ncbi:hypothetical protein [Streptomyces natalensis]|uniref:Uncharacterized protein n=1 Tax=Streptomyces natalensis ATCC 27448 TaxID=1240678 RepID=A0A0D7CGF2_9ACTN|nr:hypothetical protein [Streptomyces natalensis]KIZ14945.1 hypothetical protein SNA_29910 [Streptomyces natalensis ATCC 27448]
MDVPKLLEAAALLVPEESATGNDITVNDVWEYLVQDEWEVALDVLEDLGDIPPLPLGFWQALAAAAERLRLERSAAWCRWRCNETRHGIIRADLTLSPATEARRQIPVPGAGVLRPVWNIGNRTPAGEPSLDIAALWVEYVPFLEPGGQASVLWVEYVPFLEPGGQASVRLAPLTPARWQHLRPGQVITMHEDRSVAGTGAVVEVQRPAARPSR